MKILSRLGIVGVLATVFPATAGERVMFVHGDNLNVRLCASTECCVARRLSENEIVSVFEEKDGWSRISVFYDAGNEPNCPGENGDLIAQWVSSRFLSIDPTENYNPDEWFGSLGDRRIRGIPKVGDYGLTRADIEVIRRYAAQMLLDEQCSSIEAGNKSVSKPDTYYVYCAGESEQRFFTKADLAGR